jgi:hypothetical protein
VESMRFVTIWLSGLSFSNDVLVGCYFEYVLLPGNDWLTTTSNEILLAVCS